MVQFSIYKSGLITVGFVVLKLIIETIIRKSRNPHKPTWICFVDNLLSYLKVLKLSIWSKPNNVYQGLKTAMAETGLSDLGGKDQKTFIERYNTTRLLGMERSRCIYSPIGYALTSHAVKERMKSRLLLVDFMKNHPAVADIEMKQPIFVIGFPRTGTTFLHELLSLHPSVRVHYTWEQMEAVPSTDNESIEALQQERLVRYEKNKKTFNKILLFVSDDIQSIHRIGYDEPEECTTPCASELPYAICELPLYIYAAKEVIDLKGGGESFEFYKKYLQLMTWQSSDRRDKDFIWMLKCPFHLPYLEELYQTFPGATVVWTHRDPVECIASACSLYETLLRMIMEEASIDRIALGKAVVDYTRLALDMGMRTFVKYEKKVKVVHIRYADNVKNPKTCLQDICSKAGLAYDVSFTQPVDQYLAENAKKRADLKASKGSNAELHAYKPEDYGLTAAGIRHTFQDYIDKFNLAK